MTAPVNPLRSTSVKAHSRRLPGRSPVYYRTHEQLAEEVAEIAIEKAMREFAEEFPDECLRDPVFVVSMGLPV